LTHLPGDPQVISKRILQMVAPLPCDVNADGSIDSLDIDDIVAVRNLPAATAGSRYDVDGDGVTLPACALPQQ